MCKCSTYVMCNVHKEELDKAEAALPDSYFEPYGFTPIFDGWANV
jgi:hypothetical protein